MTSSILDEYSFPFLQMTKNFPLCALLLGVSLSTSAIAASTNNATNSNSGANVKNAEKTPKAESAIAIKNGAKLAFLGDSITMFGMSQPDGYIHLVTNGLSSCGVEVTPIGAGIGGNTSHDMLGRVNHDVIAKKPDWVTISCGVNDVWHQAHGGVPLDIYKTNMTSIVDQCQAAGIKVMILTATMIYEDQTNSFNQQLVPYNEFLRTLAKEKHCLLADLNAEEQAVLKLPGVPVINPANPLRMNRLTGDGVHMNPFGNQMMASGILRAFGLTDAQLQAAKENWNDMPHIVNVGMISVSPRQYKALETIASQHHQSVADLLKEPLAKAADNLMQNVH